MTSELMRNYIVYMLKEKVRFEEHSFKDDKEKTVGLSPVTVNTRMKTLRTFLSSYMKKNRFLWVIVQRSKVLPEGGKFHEENIDSLVEELNSIVKFSNQVGELKKDEQAREAWPRVYEGLSEGVPGLVGSVTSRAEAQTMRLACLYALLDRYL